MGKKFETWIKKNKWLAIGIGVVLCVLMYFLFFGRKSTPSTGAMQLTPGVSRGGGGVDPGGGGGGGGSGADNALLQSLSDNYKTALDKMKQNSEDAINKLNESMKKMQSDSDARIQQLLSEMRGQNDTISRLNNQIQQASQSYYQPSYSSYDSPSYSSSYNEPARVSTSESSWNPGVVTHYSYDSSGKMYTSNTPTTERLQSAIDTSTTNGSWYSQWLKQQGGR